MLPSDAGILLYKAAQWVRLGLQDGSLPIGCAVRGEGGRWSYDIRPERLAAYMGITVDELWDRLEKARSA